METLSLGIQIKGFFGGKKGPLLPLRAIGFLGSMCFFPASFFKGNFLGLFHYLYILVAFIFFFLLSYRIARVILSYFLDYQWVSASL